MLGQVAGAAVKAWLQQPVRERMWDDFELARVNDKQQPNQGVIHSWHSEDQTRNLAITVHALDQLS